MLLGSFTECRRETPCNKGTLAAHLLSIRDSEGVPLPPARLWSEVSVFFLAGVRTLTSRSSLTAAHGLTGRQAERVHSKLSSHGDQPQ